LRQRSLHLPVGIPIRSNFVISESDSPSTTSESDYTSIGRLKAYGVKRFKVAPHFINPMASDPTSAAVVRAMISLANQLGIELIAKNIETEAQEHFLLSIAESPEAQGYFYSKPLTSSANDRIAAAPQSGRRCIPNRSSSPSHAVGDSS
jgi:predicted signal transduction protein with EAL and GGDEF domain